MALRFNFSMMTNLFTLRWGRLLSFKYRQVNSSVTLVLHWYEMPKKNLVNPRKINPQVQGKFWWYRRYVCMYIWFDWGWCDIVESTAPELLRITLQVLRLVNAAPVQLRRVAAGWRLAVRPSRLENFRFLIAIMLGMFVRKHLNYLCTVHTYSITYEKI